jgi:hypothetical protein
MELSGHSMKGNRVDPGAASLRVLFFFLSFPPQSNRAEQSRAERVLLAWDDGDAEQVMPNQLQS